MMDRHSTRETAVGRPDDVVVDRILAKLLLTHVVQFDAVEVGLFETCQNLNMTAKRIVVKKPAQAYRPYLSLKYPVPQEQMYRTNIYICELF